MREETNPTVTSPIGVEITEKTCSTCRETKTIDNFYRNRYRKDGYTPQCKSCHDLTSQRKRARTRDSEAGIKRCPRCKRWLGYDNFRADGKSSYCRECQTAYQRHQNPPSESLKLKQELLAALKGDPADYKWCSIGQNYHAKSDFNQNKTRPDGLDTSCRTCRNNYQRNRRVSF